MSSAYYGRRAHGIGTNAPPTPQAATQASVVANKESHYASYHQQTSDVTASGDKYVSHYFSPKVSDKSILEWFDINEYDIVWALKKYLIGNFTTSRGFHESNAVKMLKVRSAFNNFQFEDITDFFIEFLRTEGDAGYNDKYISELMAALVMPVGVAKVKVPFSIDPAKTITTQDFEIMTSGCVLTKVRSPDAFLKHGYHVRYVVPTPSEWNNSRWYVLGEPLGKITMHVEPITVHNDEERLRTVHTGYFGNDCHRMHGFLKDVHEAHRSVQPLLSIPRDFLHLLSAIYIDVTKRDIATGVLKLNNRYKYQSIANFFSGYFQANAAVPVQDHFNTFLTRSKAQSQSTIASIMATVYLKAMPGSHETMTSLESYARNASGDPILIVEHIDLGGVNFDVVNPKGYTEEAWVDMLRKDGDAALDWTKGLYFKTDHASTKPMTEQPATYANPLNMGMIGDYLLQSKAPTPAGPDLNNISREEVIKEMKNASENWAIVAAQYLGLVVPTGFYEDASSRMIAEGYLYTHRNDPKFMSIIRDCEARSQRLIVEVARQLMSEYMPSTLKERSRVGFDHKRSVNKAMKSNKDGHYIFNEHNDLGKLSKECTTVFGDFMHGMAAYNHHEREKVQFTIIEAGKPGNIAVAYVK
jgi:hypothetical protein